MRASNSRSCLCISLVLIALVALLASSPAAGRAAARDASPTAPVSAKGLFTFSGCVYEGYPGPSTPGIEGVEVAIYGANNSGEQGALIDRTDTDRDGCYALSVPDENFNYSYLNIKEWNLAGSASVDASSIGGIVVTYDWIQYTSWGGKIKSDNNFWDVWPAPTATDTRTPTRTFTWPANTLTPTATATRTRTPTATLSAGGTPTRTPTSAPMAPWFVWKDWFLRDPQTGWLVARILPDQVVQPDKTFVVGFGVWANQGPGAGLVIARIDITDSYDTNCLSFEPKLNAPPGDAPDDPADDGSIHWSDWARMGANPGIGVYRPDSARFRTKADPRCSTTTNRIDVLVTDDQGRRYTYSAAAPLRIAAPPIGALKVTKTLLEPANGIANAGDVVRFRVEVANTGTTPISGFDLKDLLAPSAGWAFDLAYYTHVPPGAISFAEWVRISDAAGAWLILKNLTLPAGGRLEYEMVGRVWQAATVIKNCAYYYIPGSGPIVGAAGPLSCVEVTVNPLAGHSMQAGKTISNPSTHLARVGDPIDMQTWVRNTGSLTGTTPVTLDRFTAGCVQYSDGAPFNTWYYDWSGWQMFGPGLTFALGWPSGSLRAAAPCAPAVNVAQWTTTWADDGTQETATASDYVYIQAEPIAGDLRVQKERIAPAGAAVVSETLVYRVSVSNLANTARANLTAQDTFDAGCMTFLGATIPHKSITLAGDKRVIEFNPMPALSPGQVGSYELRFHADAACPVAMNCFRVGSPAGFVADCASAEIRGGQPELRVSKTRLTASPVAPGNTIDWRLVISNTGSAPFGPAVLRDTYDPADFEFVSASPPPDRTAPGQALLAWDNLGTLGPGQSRSVTVRLRALRAGPARQNCARSLYQVGSVSLTPIECAGVDVVAPGPAISIEKVRAFPSPGDQLAVGDSAVFSVTVRNVGNTPLTDIAVDDQFDPTCLTFEYASGPATALIQAGALRWAIPPLNPGGVATWSVALQGKAACGAHTNCVTAQAKGPAGQPVSANSCADMTLVAAQPALRVSKRLVEPFEQPVAGDLLHFEIVVHNAGNATLTTVPVTDTFAPACYAFFTAQPDPDSVNAAAGQLVWNNVGPLAPGETKAIRVLLRGRAACAQAQNSVRASGRSAGGATVSGVDSVQPYIGLRHVYLPVIRKSRPPTPTRTPTRTRTPSRTPTPTRTPTGAPANTWVVNTTDDADDGACNAAHCSLREALKAANTHAGPDTVAFNIPAGDPGRNAAGVCTIQPQSLLPFLTDNATTVDGFTQPGASAGPPLTLKIVLDGHNNGEFSALGVQSADNLIRGLVIGRFTPFTGIDIQGPAAQRNRVESSYIGTDVSGTVDWGNGTLPYSSAGVWVKDGAQHNTIGPNNLIAYNSVGVWVTDSATTGNTITRNRIRSNDTKGIWLYDVAMAEPAITAVTATSVSGTACAGCTVEVFSDAADEGAIYEGMVTVSAAGQWTLSKAAGFAGPYLTATARNAAGSTSEFSGPVHK